MTGLWPLGLLQPASAAVRGKGLVECVGVGVRTSFSTKDKFPLGGICVLFYFISVNYTVAVHPPGVAHNVAHLQLKYMYKNHQQF